MIKFVSSCLTRCQAMQSCKGLLAFGPPHLRRSFAVQISVEAYTQQLVAAVRLSLQGQIDALQNQQTTPAFGFT